MKAERGSRVGLDFQGLPYILMLQILMREIIYGIKPSKTIIKKASKYFGWTKLNPNIRYMISIITAII